MCEKFPLLILSQAGSSGESGGAARSGGEESTFFEQSMEQLDSLSGEDLRRQCFGKAYASLSTGLKRAFTISFSDAALPLTTPASSESEEDSKADARPAPTD